ncbi:rhamnogalacturonan acetylesterase [Paractinoplanes toevensis]|uniref:Rhamnogalacturonan acetylesterase n=1 Tax=Paractinoplanes toevensis TaxID=571911 RepID=A0A919T546_9ACTN|nr:rhamnogalacturonan acetylesterase [Actinoplanes toevensis]GIM88542.1 rhamnogalacturonan acetylesterase [Actinoplanes toevensis]
MSWLACVTCAAVGLIAPSAATTPAACTGTAPIVCHYDVAPGNYDITATIGAGTGLAVEARRRIFTPGEAGTRSATVNVREPEGQPTGQGGTGTPGLTLSFDGTAPSVTRVTVRPAKKARVVYLAGDSTVCDQPVSPYTGWGQMITASVPRGVVVANYADSGESAGSFLADPALFPTMQPLIAPGDVVLIQFGHNDKTTTAEDYRANLTALLNGVREKHGFPILVTPTVRRLFAGTELNPTALHINSLGVDLPAEMRAVAATEGVPLIDLTAKSEALVESLGPAESSRLYLTLATDGVNDNTHFSEYGATRMAELVIDSLR